MKTDRLIEIKKIHDKMVHDCKIWDTHNIYADQIEAQKDLIADAEELAELKEHLKEIECNGYSAFGEELCCPACAKRLFYYNCVITGHAAGCWLANAIKG